MNGQEPHLHKETAHKLARFALFGFLVTFILARVFVFLIMADLMPNMYCFVSGTHVHHRRNGGAAAAGTGIGLVAVKKLKPPNARRLVQGIWEFVLDQLSVLEEAWAKKAQKR